MNNNSRICPDCQNELDESVNICDRCGHIIAAPSITKLSPKCGSTNILSEAENFPPPYPIERPLISTGICSACGYENLAGEMFCRNCGVQLPPVKSSPPPPPEKANILDSGSAAHPGIQELQKIKGPSAENRRLIVVSNGEVIPLPTGREILLGRSDPILDIYPDLDLTPYDGDRRGISRRHARIYILPEGAFIEDLESTNFTFVNRFRLEPGKRYPLKDGDEVRLGLLVLEYFS